MNRCSRAFFGATRGLLGPICLVLVMPVAVAQQDLAQAPPDPSYSPNAWRDTGTDQGAYYQPPPGPFSGAPGQADARQGRQNATEWSNRWGQFEPQWPSQAPAEGTNPSSAPSAGTQGWDPGQAGWEAPQAYGRPSSEPQWYSPPTPVQPQAMPWYNGQWPSGPSSYDPTTGQWQGGQSQWVFPESSGLPQAPVPSNPAAPWQGTGYPSPYSPGGSTPMQPGVGGYGPAVGSNPYSGAPASSQWQWRSNDYGNPPPGGWIWPNRDKKDK